MQSKRVVIALLAALAVAASGLVAAAGKATADPTSAPRMGMERKGMDHDKMMGGGMMGEGMMGMMGMMSACNRMMDSGTMPHLPPGNEKLELRMRAEMMQKMGEILNKYADQIKDEQGGPR